MVEGTSACMGFQLEFDTIVLRIFSFCAGFSRHITLKSIHIFDRLPDLACLWVFTSLLSRDGTSASNSLTIIARLDVFFLSTLGSGFAAVFNRPSARFLEMATSAE